MSESGSYVLRTIDGGTDRRGAYSVARGAVGSRPGRSWNATNSLTLSYTVGRQAAGQSFDAAVIQFSFVLDSLDDYDDLRMGDRVVININPKAQALLGVDISDVFRVKGFVTDLDLSYRKQGSGIVGVVHATASGPLARMGQATVGATPWYMETPRMRLDRLAPLVKTAIGRDHPEDYSIYYVGTEAAYLAPQDVDRRSAADLARGWAEDTGGLFYESTAGRLTFEAADGRRNRAAIAQLQADQIASGTTWAQSLGGLVNRLTLSYGLSADAQTELTVLDQASIDEFGEYATGKTTQLAHVEDAQRVGALTVGRNSSPHWSISRVEVDLLRSVPRDVAGALVVADVGDLVELVGMPSTSPGGRYVFVEGVEVTLTAHDWRLVLFLSDASRTGAPLRWQDVDPALTWAQATTDDYGDPLTWLGAASWFDPPTTGDVYRWLDVPVDQRWFHLAPGENRDAGDLRAPTWSSYPNDPA